jgi:hypothetical protein
VVSDAWRRRRRGWDGGVSCQSTVGANEPGRRTASGVQVHGRVALVAASSSLRGVALGMQSRHETVRPRSTPAVTKPPLAADLTCRALRARLRSLCGRVAPDGW